MRRVWLARGLAIAADALQIAVFPAFIEGAFSPIDDVLDILMAVALTLLLGWNIAFVPSFLIKALPIADLAPTWTIAVLIAGRGRAAGEGVLAGLGAGEAGEWAGMPWRLWYNALIKPYWTPSPRTISIIWTLLYPLIAVTFGYVFALVLMHRLPARVALPFAINLAANLLFTPILFRLKNLPLATIDILIALLTLVWAMAAIWPWHPWVTFTEIPYLAWVCIAAGLQVIITQTNLRKANGLAVVNRVRAGDPPLPPLPPKVQ